MPDALTPIDVSISNQPPQTRKRFSRGALIGAFGGLVCALNFGLALEFKERAGPMPNGASIFDIATRPGISEETIRNATWSNRFFVSGLGGFALMAVGAFLHGRQKHSKSIS